MDTSEQLHRVQTLLNTLSILEGQYNDPECEIEEECINLFTSMEEIKKSVEELRSILRDTVDQMKITASNVEKIKNLNQYMDHIRSQLPEEVVDESILEPKLLMMDGNETANQTASSPVPRNWALLTSPPNVANRIMAPPVSRVEDALPSITYVTEAEVNAVPKYMKGRCTAVSINKLIECLNLALRKKYETLGKPKRTIKQKDLEYYYEWKRTENMEPKGAYFITINDINTFGGTKMDKASLNMITILRHLKRLKETRHVNNQVHYVLTGVREIDGYRCV